MNLKYTFLSILGLSCGVALAGFADSVSDASGLNVKPLDSVFSEQNPNVFVASPSAVAGAFNASKPREDESGADSPNNLKPRKSDSTVGVPDNVKTQRSVSTAEIPTYKNPSAPVESRVEDLLGRMTQEEKILQLSQYTLGRNTVENNLREMVGQVPAETGSVIYFSDDAELRNAMQKRCMEESRLGIPMLFGHDVIHGYRTITPVPLAQAASWNPELVQTVCADAAAEASACGVDWTFSPMLDVAHDPRWGRVMEGYGEDVYLTSVMGQAAVRGYQGDDLAAKGNIAACLKHFVGYAASEAGRDYVYTEISDQTLWDTYLPPFKAGVDAGAVTVMSAFNTISGIPASANYFTMTEVLRNMWGFDGFVVSDWDAVIQLCNQGFAETGKDAADLAINAGIDMDMMDNLYRKHLPELLDEGRVSQETLDECVRRILRIKFRLGLFENPYTEIRSSDKIYLQPSALSNAEQMAQESMVLLKNAGSLLPLGKNKHIALIGPLADTQAELIGNWRARGRAEEVISILKGMTAEFGGDVVSYALGCDFETADSDMLADALDVADKSDVVVLCLGEKAKWSGENCSRSSIALPEVQENLLREIRVSGKPVVVLVASGRPVDLSRIEPLADAIVEIWMPGTTAGNAVAGILSGKYNPSGRLPMTFPYTTGQIPIYYNRRNSARRGTQGLYKDIQSEPLYKFGYGLSYTEYEYSPVTLSSESVTADGTVTASVTVTNTGSRDGKETVQWYICDPYCSIARPVRELKRFEKSLIKAGESKTFTFEINPQRDLAFVDRNGKPLLEKGSFKVFVGDKEAEFNLVDGQSFARREMALTDGWKFHLGEVNGGASVGFDDSGWASVTVPHDWAITGPFSIDNDLQNVQVTQNFETKASLKTGRTGGLPYVGVGWYRRELPAYDGSDVTLLFDGAMSEAQVYVNGEKVCFWPYGYSSFYCDITPYLKKDGSPNTLAVKLENLPFSSRWYPGAGLYRNVHLISTSPRAHIPVWGTFATTSNVTAESASVSLDISVEGAPEGDVVEYSTCIYSPDGKIVASENTKSSYHKGVAHSQHFFLHNPELWSPESPALYKAVTEIRMAGISCDKYETVFGVRSIEFVPDKGFYLNGKHCKFKGVCNHHDLGPLGAAVSVPALRHQLALLKDMGCNAIRTSHNIPAPELVRLCDEMGFMMMVEPFDEWDEAKCRNGYHRFFDEWAEKDIVNMIRCYRNSPSVIMWSIGNEVPSQNLVSGCKTAAWLQSICHREDPTRPVTCGMDQVSDVLSNGFAAVLDIPGINYRTFRYGECYEKLPHGFVLGSETASTVSSRGVYHFPVEKEFSVLHDDHQCSSYDMASCKWSNIPDVDFALSDDYPWVLGQFAWTGFDYLGEPSPYDKDSWPNHSSMFGIIDLASIPKDRYWLYRSQWNTESSTLHIVPHWTWPGREGETTPVYVYTSYPEAELFVNGVSQGRRKKVSNAPLTDGAQDASVEGRYRLMWDDVVYHKGSLKVVAYDKDGNPVMEKTVRTAGKPASLKLSCDRTSLTADGEDLAYVTVSVVDKNGNEVPYADNEVSVKVTGAGHFRAITNGDPTCLESFQEPRMHLFSGKLTVIVQSDKTLPGAQSGKHQLDHIRLEVSSKGLKSATVEIPLADMD